jgi:hypothetical protein
MLKFRVVGVTSMLALEIVFAVTAGILSALSLLTHRSIKHLHVGRAFWIPVFMSSTLFLIGSLVNVLFEFGLAIPFIYLTTDEFVQLTRIFAICSLVGGIYSYSRQVRSILPKEEPKLLPDVKVKLTLASEQEDENVQKKGEFHEGPYQSTAVVQDEQAMPTESIHCEHELGYLQTLPRDAPLPDECYSCDRIIDCKHSPIKKTAKTTA